MTSTNHSTKKKKAKYLLVDGGGEKRGCDEVPEGEGPSVIGHPTSFIPGQQKMPSVGRGGLFLGCVTEPTTLIWGGTSKQSPVLVFLIV